MESSSSLRIAIQKNGRLTEKSIDLLENIGLRFDEYKNRLMVRCRNFDVELLLIRDDDIPEYVQDGVCDLGLVGANVTAEKQADVTVLRDLDFGYCRLSLAAPKNGDIKEVTDFESTRVATSYPVLTQKYFQEQGITARTVEISGAVEITPTLDVADAICDIVSSGSTLRANGLKEIQPIFQSQTQMIKTNKELPQEKLELIEKFLIRIEGSQTAEKSRYIMMNAPEDSVEEIIRIIPSLKSPTVLPLAEKNMVAIHSVIPIKKFWDVMEQLKETGATGIVILPIENMIF
ncbi:MAG TPA: ATP phosphoribosyltransferase [Balneolales bacterium]|nr:ATP phosphoribosyltransferase [Balneolales bacterium]